MRGNVGHGLEGVPHPAGARHLAEGPDVRQPGRAITGLEQNALYRLASLLARLDAGQQLAGLLEGPSLGGKRLFAFYFYGRVHFSLKTGLSVSKGRES